MKNKLTINYRAVTFMLIGLTVGFCLDSLARSAIELHQNPRYALDGSVAFFLAYVVGSIVFLIGIVNSIFWIKWIIKIAQRFLQIRQFSLYWSGVSLWFGSLITLLGLMILSSLHLLIYLSWCYTVLLAIGLIAICINVLTFLILLLILGFNQD